MAATLSTKIYKDRGQENLRNRSQIDHARAKMSNYSVADFAVGSGDTLGIQLLNIPAGAVIKSVTVTPKVLNGATLVCTISTDSTAGNAIHGTTFNLNANAGTPQYKVATTTSVAAATPLYLQFAASADVNASVLDLEVAVEFYFASLIGDEAGLTS